MKGRRPRSGVDPPAGLCCKGNPPVRTTGPSRAGRHDRPQPVRTRGHPHHPRAGGLPRRPADGRRRRTRPLPGRPRRQLADRHARWPPRCCARRPGACATCRSPSRGPAATPRTSAHIKEVGHGSVLEHAVWNFLITGVSRTPDARTGPPPRPASATRSCQQRYVDESVAEYVEPDVIADDPELHALWLDAVGQAHRAYVQARREAGRTEAPGTSPDRTAAPQGRPAGGPQRAAQRHRDEDLRHRQRPRPAALPRTARQPARRAGDPQAGLPNARRPAAGAPHLFGDYERRRCPTGRSR